MNETKWIPELQRWKAEALTELESAQTDLAVAQQRVEACRERLRLLERLIAVETGAEVVPANQKPLAQAAGPPRLLVDELLDACERVIQNAGRPLHISELHAALLNEGIPIPGRGSEANLLVRLHRSNGRFIRTGRGTYAPVSMGAPEVRPTQRRRVGARSRQ